MCYEYYINQPINEGANTLFHVEDLQAFIAHTQKNYDMNLNWKILRWGCNFQLNTDYFEAKPQFNLFHLSDLEICIL